MYICNECGMLVELLPEHKEYVPFGDDYVPMSVEDDCCRCGGYFDEAARCTICGEYVSCDELTNDVCQACCDKEMTYETALDYLKERGLLKDFCKRYFESNYGESLEEKINKELALWFKRQAANDKIFGKSGFLCEVKGFIKEDIPDWTEYLSEG